MKIRGNSSRRRTATELLPQWLWTGMKTQGQDWTTALKVVVVKNTFSEKRLNRACLNTDGKEPDNRLSLTIWNRAGRRSSKQWCRSGMNRVARELNLQNHTLQTEWVENRRQTQIRAINRRGRGLFVKIRAYIGNFASWIITENIRKLARWINSRKRKSFLTAVKPFTDTEKLFAGGATGLVQKGEKGGFGLVDNNKIRWKTDYHFVPVKKRSVLITLCVLLICEVSVKHMLTA